MATGTYRTRKGLDWRALPAPAELVPGDRLTRAEFARLYERVRDKRKYELVKGVVHMASPLYLPHAETHGLLATVLGVYAARTPGVRFADNVSLILGDNEVQPDLLLRVLPEYGGAAKVLVDAEGRETKLQGPPELVIEVSESSRSVDLTDKRDLYQEAGVREYIVASLQESRLYFWDLQQETRYEPDESGILRSVAFPGLWLEESAVFAGESAQSLRLVEQGGASDEHARFAAALSDRRATPDAGH